MMAEAIAENERQYRVVDQMLTAHSKLRDRYRRRGTLLSVTLLSVSIALNAFVFASDDVLKSLGLRPNWAKNGLSVAAILTLILSIVDMKVDWSGRSNLHRQAAERLGQLKLLYRSVYEKVKNGDAVEAERLNKEYAQIVGSLTPIPEAELTKLAAQHRYKQLLQTRLSNNPTVPVWLLRLKLRFEGISTEFAPETWRKGDKSKAARKR